MIFQDFCAYMTAHFSLFLMSGFVSTGLHLGDERLQRDQYKHMVYMLSLSVMFRSEIFVRVLGFD